MLDQLRIATPNKVLKSLGVFLAAGAAFVVFSTTTPAAAFDGVNISDFNLSFDDDEDLLEQLIALDADDIQDMREEFADALDEIDDAMDDIDDAREEAKATPGGGAVLKIAFGAASIAITESVDTAFEKVRAELDDASARLLDMKGTLDAAEFSETQEAISVIRTGLDDIEAALDKLVAAMKA